MKITTPKPLPVIGFLTVCDFGEQGIFGGLLMLNAVGRPLEFHCTAPVRSNRAQEILYGPTLKPFLYGEHIGRSLVGKTRLDPLLLVTDVAPALAVRDFTSAPVALLVRPEGDAPLPACEEPTGGDGAAAADGAEYATLSSFHWGLHRLAVTADHAEDREQIARRLNDKVGSLDLLEPFARIRAAIDEARRQVRS